MFTNKLTQQQKQTFSRNLRLCAASEGITQKQLSEALGVNRTTISRAFSGKQVPYELVFAAAKKYDKPVEDFLNKSFADV